MPDLGFDASYQLQNDLEASVIQALSSSRPILTHWNADTTWSLSLAYPSHARPSSGRLRYNILIDPWLAGPQSDVAGWFSTQWHAIKSSVQTVAELNDHLELVETLASRAEPIGKKSKRGREIATKGKPHNSYIDAVVASHEFSDHCHKRQVKPLHLPIWRYTLMRNDSTLVEVDRSVPVFATKKAAELIRSWNHFDDVLDIPTFTNNIDWRTTSQNPLPSWIGLSRLTTKSDALYYHSAVVICFGSSDEPGTAEAVIYTPHGVQADSFTAITSSEPPVHTLALLHGLHDVSIALTKQLNLGAHNALKAQRILHSKYWVGTHDEVKIGGGLIAPFLRRKAYSIMDALGTERPEEKLSVDLQSAADATDVSYVDLASGESLLLA